MQVPVGTLPSGMKLGFLEMESLTSHNQFLLGLGINSDNHNSLLCIDLDLEAKGLVDDNRFNALFKSCPKKK